MIRFVLSTAFFISMSLVQAQAQAQVLGGPLAPPRFSSPFIGAPPVSVSICNQQENPHTFECHDMTFSGQSEFPLVTLNTLQGEWSAVTYAVRGSNHGAGFMMDKNQFRPSMPGRGVFNLLTSGHVGSSVGSLFISGDRATFQNWQGSPMTSTPGSLVFLDQGTVQFKSVDHMGIQHAFQCRDFLRKNNHHLTCRWLVLRQGQWDFVGYFGFLTRQTWDQFIMMSGGRRR